MEIIAVNRDNITTEHICCAISDKKGECCVSSKKEWMIKRFEDGLVFKKLDVRGKVFIEYIPIIAAARSAMPPFAISKLVCSA